MQRTNDFYLIDLSKVVMAWLVVAGHTGVAQLLPATLDYMLEIRMSLYFAFSGFFFAPAFKLSRSLRHLTPMLLIYAVASAPLIHAQFAGDSVGEILHYIVFSAYGVTWFVMAIIWCMIITSLVNRLVANRRLMLIILLIIGAFFYLLTLAESGYADLLRSTWVGSAARAYCEIGYTLMWSFPRGLLCFAIGATFRLLSPRPRKTSAFIFLAIALVVYFSEFKIDIHFGIADYGACFTRPLMTAGVLAALLSLCRPTDRWTQGAVARQYSTMLYFSHPIWIFLLSKFTPLPLGPWMMITVLLLFAIQFAIFRYLNTKPAFRWLRYAA